MRSVWARLIMASPARGHLEVTLSVFLDSGGSWSFFVQEIYIKSNARLSKNTNVFESSFFDNYFTGSFDFFYFLFFFSLTAFISGIWYFFAFLNFYWILHGHVNMRELISYLCMLLIGIGKKLVHVPLSGSHIRLLKIRQ